MADNEKNVIVFGPTGAVGRAAALEARRRGATVWLAMRDPEKKINGIEHNATDFHRSRADLSKPQSLSNAVEQSGAKTAFVYVLFESEDNMRASFEALKTAGITYIVFLSSYTVVGPAEEKGNSEHLIPRVHAQTEMVLEETGISYVAVRAAYFSSNVFWYTAGIKQGEVELAHPQAVFDYIVPDDIGTVCGSFLVERKFQNAKLKFNAITLLGPDLYSQEDAFDIVGQVIGRPIKVKEIDEDTFVQQGHVPEPVARSSLASHRHCLNKDEAYPPDSYKEGVSNISKYGGKEPTRFRDWVETNKEALL